MSDTTPRKSTPLRVAIGWVLTPIYLTVFVCTVLLWHPMIVAAFYVNQRFYRWIITLGNGALVCGLRLIGTSVTAHGFSDLPPGRAAVVVSNHQSLYDIPLLLWNLRHLTPGFIAKKELGRGIPSASHALRNMGALLIDRSNVRGSITAIEKFGVEMNRLKRAAVLFPEGTRARNGRMKHFRPQGIMSLMKTMPDGIIIPVATSGSWKLTCWNLLPVFPGARIHVHALAPIEVSALSLESAPEHLESLIRSALPLEEGLAPEPK